MYIYSGMFIIILYLVVVRFIFAGWIYIFKIHTYNMVYKKHYYYIRSILVENGKIKMLFFSTRWNNKMTKKKIKTGLDEFIYVKEQILIYIRENKIICFIIQYIFIHSIIAILNCLF